MTDMRRRRAREVWHIPRRIQRSYLPASRRLAGWAITAAGVPLLTLLLAQDRRHLSLGGDLMAYLLLVVAAATTGGLGPAIASAFGSSLATTWYFTPPYHQLDIDRAGNVVSLIAFVVVGSVVAYLVSLAARRRAEAAEARVVREADALRTALLRAVSHDLRSPLASIKASVSSLLQTDVRWTETDIADFLATIDEETDRLDTLVGNLLDMSRLQAGAVAPQRQIVAPEDVIASAVASLSEPDDRLDVVIADDVPAVVADAVLLERVLANVVTNAMHHTNGHVPIVIEAGRAGGKVHLRVIDRGPGIPRTEREQLFEPFQQLGDQSGGVGLGLAVARGFMTAMSGSIVLDDTPGGGLTVDLALDAADMPHEPAKVTNP